MQVEYHPQAADDLNTAICYYDTQRPGLGEELRIEVYSAIDRIKATPHIYPVVTGSIRRCLVRRFPFSLLYSIVDSKTIRILLIRHHRQNPARRLENRR